MLSPIGHGASLSTRHGYSNPRSWFPDSGPERHIDAFPGARTPVFSGHRPVSGAAFTPAWLADEPAARALLPRGIFDPEARRTATRRAAERRIDPTVLAALERRYADDDGPRKAHLAALRAGGAACVVTGQQAGLFGGPLYTVHKAASAIRLAARLQAESGVPCAPVFWVQSEDHDFAEIATAHTLAGSGAIRSIALPEDAADADRAVADRRMGPAIDGALDALAETLAGLEAADAVMALMRRCYRAERSPVGAFRALVEALFARHGLLVLDPRDPAEPGLAKAAAPVHRRALDAAAGIADVLIDRCAALEAAGFAVQVHVRPGAPLSFWHADGPDGPRFRLEPADDGWRTCGGPEHEARAVDRATLDAALRDDPRRFGTSALLRPILQDAWLPTAAYVGGPGEIAYFAQLPPLYAAFDLPLPLVAHRARLRVIDSTADRLLDQLGLDPDRLSAPRHALLTAIAGDGGEHPDPDALEAALIEPVARALDDFRPHAEALDKGLHKALDKTAETLADVARRLVDRYRRTLARDDAVTTERLDRLLARLWPHGGPQERTLGLPWFTARYGIEAFVDAVLAAVDLDDPRSKDLRP